MRIFKKGLLGRCSAVAAMLCLAAQPAAASNSWLSSVEIIPNGGSGTTYLLNDMSQLGRTSGTAVFNIVISLEENPQGDDVYPADSGTGDDAQNAFEAKIEEFADAVFQMTNGAHKIGRVTIFRDGAQATNSDVRWAQNCPRNLGPRANPSGFGVQGAYLHMCTNWDGAPTLMNTPRGGGFTMAHEWGHYAYGLYDEYVSNCGQVPETNCLIIFPRSTDTASSPSIMNNQWQAAVANGDQDFLEISTANVEPWASATDGADRNAQARVFGEPGWATLTRDPATDPRLSIIPQRTQYTNLTAPAGPDFTINDNESTARSELQIIWAGDRVVELMIDTSGSMLGQEIVNARLAADLLVSQLSPGETAIGVGRFASTPSQVFPITDIPDPDTTVRADARAAIAALNAGGGTDIEDAALFALTETQNFQGGARPAVVYLLTDGISTVNVQRVVNAYRAANVPLVTFGFGPGVREGTLRPLAEQTGGRYFFSPTTLPEIQQAFVAANAAFSNAVVSASGATTVAANAQVSVPTVLDSTMGTATIAFSYQGATTDFTGLQLLTPAGTPTPNQYTCEAAGGQVSCTAQVDVAASGAGTYTSQGTNTTGSEIVVQSIVSAESATFDAYDMQVEFRDTTYPAGLEMFATVTRGPSLTGLNVVATVTQPDNTTVQVPLLDNGQNADQIADDGVYSASIVYTQDGTYSATVRADNAQGQAQTSFNNVLTSIGEDGTATLPVPQTISENFTRVSLARAAVSNFSADDHGNTPATPGSCTTIQGNNTDTLGRIDSAGDVDCFVFVPGSTTSDLIVRATQLRDGLTPVVRVYNAAGTTELLSVNLTNSANPASGAIVRVPAASLESAGHVVTVEHSDATATQGRFALSVGPALSSDTPVQVSQPPQPPQPQPGPSGGALGPIGLLIGLLLAAIGITRRRPNGF